MHVYNAHEALSVSVGPCNGIFSPRQSSPVFFHHIPYHTYSCVLRGGHCFVPRRPQANCIGVYRVHSIDQSTLNLIRSFSHFFPLVHTSQSAQVSSPTHQSCGRVGGSERGTKTRQSIAGEHTTRIHRHTAGSNADQKLWTGSGETMAVRWWRRWCYWDRVWRSGEPFSKGRVMAGWWAT